MKTIREIHNLSEVPVYNSLFGTREISCPNLVFGIELEMENFDPESGRDFPGITYTEDGSLRNSHDGIGIEAITYPLQSKHIPGFLEQFFSYHDITKNNYSERCSTHLHMNVQDLTYEQLASLCLVYQTVENLLFDYIGKDREDNIFCVPWNQCGLSYTIVEKLASYTEEKIWPLRNWQKYTSLNLIPISEQGSIEFRHMGGTCDVEKITEWINILSQIHKYSTTKSFLEIQREIMEMNTISNYQEWMKEVFGKYSDVLRIPGFEKQLSSGVVDSKLSLMGESRIAKTDLENMINELRARQFTINNPETLERGYYFAPPVTTEEPEF